MTFRFILQPAMAAIAALLDGIKDARTGRSPYLWTLLTNEADRAAHLHEGLISTARIILLGLVMDSIYQFMVLKMFYPAESVIVALTLAFLPYVLLRGPISRIIRGLYRAALFNSTSAKAGALAWLRGYCPVRSLGGSILIYYFAHPPTPEPGPATPAPLCSGSVSHRVAPSTS